MHQMGRFRHPRQLPCFYFPYGGFPGDQKASVRDEMSASDKNRTTMSRRMAGMLAVGCLAFSLSARDRWAQTPPTQPQRPQPPQPPPPQDPDIPVAPRVPPSPPPPGPPPIPKPEEKKPPAV